VTLLRYRRVLALPRVRPLVLLMLLARVPTSAVGVTLTLHVVLTLHRGYAAAGIVGTASTAGIALGAPLLGRLTDRRGLRATLLVTTLAQGAFWLTAPLLTFPALVASAFAGGLLSVPAMSIGRQALAALVPEEQRRTAFSLDGMSVELTFMIGPAVAVALVTRVSSAAALVALGAATLLSGAALYLVNPPMRTSEAAAPAGPRRGVLSAPLVAVLVAGVATTMVLVGTEIAAVAALRGSGQVAWTGAVVVAACLSSLLGGLVYGALHRSVSPPVLVALLGLLVIPAGLVGGPWWALALAIAPTSFLCAPSITATSEAVARLAPDGSRGQALGWQSSAFTLGNALASPLIGFVVDRSAPAWGFAACGVLGVLVAGLAHLLSRVREPQPLAHSRAASSSAIS
jgi:MFS family permease